MFGGIVGKGMKSADHTFEHFQSKHKKIVASLPQIT